MRILSAVPTWNEAENIRPLIADILSLGPEYDVLVIDDNSPDRTWKIVEEIALGEPRVHLLHRTHTKGRGSAGVDGFKWAMAQNHYDVVVEMDADFSHQPRFIPSLAEAVTSGGADVAVGSRMIAGGGETGRHWLRPAITACANAYIRRVLKLSLRDCTSGFRAFNRKAVESLPWDDFRATGPEILQEMLIAASNRGLIITERPIIFEERRAGTSTFGPDVAINSLLAVWKMRKQRSRP